MNKFSQSWISTILIKNTINRSNLAFCQPALVVLVRTVVVSPAPGWSSCWSVSRVSRKTPMAPRSHSTWRSIGGADTNFICPLGHNLYLSASE